MRAERDVRVPMRDGIELALDLFLPDATGAHPALVAMSPYGKEMQTMRLAPQPVESSVHRRSIEASDPHFLTAHGYAHVVADVRGIGGSAGVYRGWMNRDEASDGYDLVEWVAAQTWCNGRVGMVGVSYYGAIQLHVAATQPPALKAIMPWNAPADFYREATHHGGIRQAFFYIIYGIGIRGHSVVTARENMSEDDFAAVLADLAADPDVSMYPDLYNSVRNPDRIPGYFDVLARPFDGPFYWDRSPYRSYARISIPCYFNSYWWAYAHMHLRGAFQNYAGVDVPKKLRIGSRSSNTAPLPRSYDEEVVRWYDHWLKDDRNGIMDEPPIQLFIQGAGEFRDEHEWPLARTLWTSYYLRRWGGLETEPELTPEKPDCFVQQPPDETSTIASVEYATRPFTKDTEVTGPLALTLYASIDSDDTNWIVAVADLDRTGQAVELSRGFLKASHREVDPDRSEEWLPYHPHTRSEPVPVDEVVEYRIELSPMANVFRAGHRLRLSIMAADNPFNPGDEAELGYGHRPWHIVRATTVLHRVYHDVERPSCLLVPVIPSE